MKKIIALIAILTAASAMAEYDWFATLDKNVDGKITQDEWVTTNKKNWKQKNKEFDEAKSIANFQAKDTNGDGSLSHEELLVPIPAPAK